MILQPMAVGESVAAAANELPLFVLLLVLMQISWGLKALAANFTDAWPIVGMNTHMVFQLFKRLARSTALWACALHVLIRVRFFEMRIQNRLIKKRATTF